MARERQVTRTIKSVKVVYSVYVLESKAIEERTVLVTGDVDQKTIDRMTKKAERAEGFKVLEEIKREETEQLYSMPEPDFVRLARPVTKKEQEENDSIDKMLDKVEKEVEEEKKAKRTRSTK